MKKLLPLVLILTILLSSQAVEIVDLEPFVVKAHPMGYWDFSLQFHPVESDRTIEDYRVECCEILMTLLGGSSDLAGLRTGDRIIEINWKKEWLKSKIVHFFRNGDIGDVIHLKVKKINEEIEEFDVALVDNPLGDKATTKLNGIEIKFPWNSQIMATKGKNDIYYLSEVTTSEEGKLLANDLLVTMLSDSKHFGTLKDKRTHKVKTSNFIEFDTELNYQIKKK